MDVVEAVRTSQALMPRWRLATRLALYACLPLMPALSTVVVPSGMGGVRVSQLSGTLPGTLYPGTHFVVPLIHRVELFNIRDQVFATNPSEIAKDQTPVLKVYSREGLPVGLGISVRYQLDPQRLPYVANNLPQPIETEIMPPVVANAFRQTISGYLVRDVFSTKREEVRRMAADAITRRLASDGIVVKEVMLRDVSLPPEYAKGLEGLLLKVQENDRMAIEVELKQKMVRTAELEAEAEKARHVKQAEGQRADHRARSQSAGRCDAAHAAAERETDSAKPARSRSPQRGDGEERGSGRVREGHRQQSRARETELPLAG